MTATTLVRIVDGLDETKFWSRVRKSAGCWEWTGSRTTAGYGNLRLVGGKYTYAHRVSYQLTTGPIPAGLVIDHLCRNRGCVNPDHLEAVTQLVNVRRGVAPYGLRTRCKNGHDITIPANVYTGSRGDRRCRLCQNIANAARTAVRQERGDQRKVLKSHCIRGHEFTELNTRITGDRRKCRECDNMRAREYRKRARNV